MLFYFTGTGNSRFVAKTMNKTINDTIVSINDCIKLGTREAYYSKTPIVIVTPTYAWQIPKIVLQFLKDTTFEGNRNIYFVLTCEANIGNAQDSLNTLCSDKEMRLMGVSEIIMPNNYVALYQANSVEDARKIITSSLPAIHTVAKQIKNKQILPNKKVTLLDRVNSSLTRYLFYKWIVSSKGFYAMNTCITCKRCVNICPLNTITIENNKPKWGKACTHCMACIASCPVSAIQYKKHTIGKTRYYCTKEVIEGIQE